MKKGGILKNIIMALAVGGSDVGKYGDGTLQFFGTGAKKILNVLVIAFEDAGKTGVSVATTALGAGKVGSELNKDVTNVLNDLKGPIIGVVNAVEHLRTKLTGEAGKILDGLTTKFGNMHRRVGTTYYSAFGDSSKNNGKNLDIHRH